jgi:plasmid stability protein
MSKMVQIRNVPDGLHRRLKARSAMAGMSLSDYLLAEIRRLAERPTLEEMRARIEARPPIDVREAAADIIRAERDNR